MPWRTVSQRASQFSIYVVWQTPNSRENDWKTFPFSPLPKSLCLLRRLWQNADLLDNARNLQIMLEKDHIQRTTIWRNGNSSRATAQFNLGAKDFVAPDLLLNVSWHCLPDPAFSYIYVDLSSCITKLQSLSSGEISTLHRCWIFQGLNQPLSNAPEWIASRKAHREKKVQ